MPPKRLSRNLEVLETQLAETMRAGYEEPTSFSDWQLVARAVIRMFRVERRPIALDLEYADGEGV